ncbi:NAD-dependent malic enzyme, mitochondrial [Tulasnella sp. 403]|nr:NAD-dependent malic enzyme, mitochondrial [Tulasnella sp. 403]
MPTRPILKPGTLLDFLDNELDATRTLWGTKITGVELKLKIRQLATGLIEKAHLSPRESNALLLLDDSFEFLLADMAFASLSIPTITLTRLDLLTQVVSTYPPSVVVVGFDFLDHLLEMIVEDAEDGDRIVIVVGDVNNISPSKSEKSKVPIYRWEDLFITKPSTSLDDLQPPSPTDVYTVTFTEVDDHQPHGVQLTHLNLTAGVAVTQHIFPRGKPFAPRDSIVSCHSLTTPFGRSVAYTALLRGCSFTTLPSTSIFHSNKAGVEEIIRAGENPDIPPPTVLFISSSQYIDLANAALNYAKSHWLFAYAWRHKLFHHNGGQMSNDTVWDKLVFGPARTKALGRLGQSVEKIFISGEPLLESTIIPLRLALSVPVVRAVIHVTAAGPVLASHPVDFQSFQDSDKGSPSSDFDSLSHCGPPTINAEAKLMNANHDDIEAGSDPIGELFVRGPTIGQAVPPAAEPSLDGWVKTGYQARVSSNGTFNVRPAKQRVFDFQALRHALVTRHQDKSKQVFKIALTGDALLDNPRFNKGMGFTAEEREEFDLVARLPSTVNTLDEQCERAYQQLQSRTSNIAKNTFLQSLKAQNWVLYYSLLGRHLREVLPIVYTPTEAEAIANYSHLFRKSEGLFLSYPHKKRIEKDFLHYVRGKHIDLIVVSDSEAILGIGDQGVGGIGISTAKSVIYTLVGGVDPSSTLPVVLDVGTNNSELLNDPLYVGWRQPRLTGAEYDDFVDTFMQLVRKHLPHCLVHFEDFGVNNARRILEKYRPLHAVFNDDIQGTGAVALAALMSAVGVTKSRLVDQRIIVYGAGTAGNGIACQLRDAIVQIDGASREEASAKFYMIDKDGLITQSFGQNIRHGLEEFTRPDEEWDESDRVGGKIGLLQVVKKIKPTVLIGTSTHAGGFTEEVIKEMSKHVERPIIFPLSNPTRLVEVDPANANEWTNGKALLATGSPFPPAKMPNGKDYIIAECNNALIYPGIGFGAVLTESKTVSDSMIIAGAQALAALSPALKDPDEALLPDFQDAPAVNFEVAVAVAEHAIDEGLAHAKITKSEIRERLKERQWHPVYGTYKFDPAGKK